MASGRGGVRELLNNANRSSEMFYDSAHSYNDGDQHDGETVRRHCEGYMKYATFSYEVYAELIRYYGLDSCTSAEEKSIYQEAVCERACLIYEYEKFMRKLKIFLHGKYPKLYENNSHVDMVKELHRAADQFNHPRAQYNLGSYYLRLYILTDRLDRESLYKARAYFAKTEFHPKRPKLEAVERRINATCAEIVKAGRELCENSDRAQTHAQAREYFEKAIKFYDSAIIDYNSTHALILKANALVNYGARFRNQTALVQAIQCAEEAIRLSAQPKHVPAYAIARAYLNINNRDNRQTALDWITKAIAWNVGNSDVRNLSCLHASILYWSNPGSVAEKLKAISILEAIPKDQDMFIADTLDLLAILHKSFDDLPHLRLAEKYYKQIKNTEKIQEVAARILELENEVKAQKATEELVAAEKRREQARQTERCRIVFTKQDILKLRTEFEILPLSNKRECLMKLEKAEATLLTAFKSKLLAQNNHVELIWLLGELILSKNEITSHSLANINQRLSVYVDGKEFDDEVSDIIRELFNYFDSLQSRIKFFEDMAKQNANINGDNSAAQASVTPRKGLLARIGLHAVAPSRSAAAAAAPSPSIDGALTPRSYSPFERNNF